MQLLTTRYRGCCGHCAFPVMRVQLYRYYQAQTGENSSNGCAGTCQVLSERPGGEQRRVLWLLCEAGSDAKKVHTMMQVGISTASVMPSDCIIFNRCPKQEPEFFLPRPDVSQGLQAQVTVSLILPAYDNL